MNDLALNATCTTAVTMTLKEITDLLDVRHDKAMLKVAAMAESPDFGTVSILDIVYNDKGQTTKTYQLDKRQSIAVAANLNTALLMRIIDRWQELEGRSTSASHADFERYASKLIAMGILPGMVGWWSEQLNGGYHGFNEWNIDIGKASVSEMRYSFRNYQQRHGLYGIPDYRGNGYFYDDKAFKVSLTEVADVWSLREFKQLPIEQLRMKARKRAAEYIAAAELPSKLPLKSMQLLN